MDARASRAGLRELAEAAGLTAQFVEFQIYSRLPPWGRLFATTRHWGARAWDARVMGVATAFKVILEVGSAEPIGPGPGPWRIETWVESLGAPINADRMVFREALAASQEASDHHWRLHRLGDRWRLPIRVDAKPVGATFQVIVVSDNPEDPYLSANGQDWRTTRMHPAYLHPDGAPVWAEEVP